MGRADWRIWRFGVSKKASKMCGIISGLGRVPSVHGKCLLGQAYLKVAGTLDVGIDHVRLGALARGSASRTSGRRKKMQLNGCASIAGSA